MIMQGHILLTPQLPYWTAGVENMFLTCHTAPAWALHIFPCLANLKNISEVSDFNLITIKSRMRSGFESKMFACTMWNWKTHHVL
jgi:hypothetical protein